MAYNLPLRPILILPSRLRLGLARGLFSLGLPVTILKTLLSPCIMATWPAHRNLIDLITLNKPN